MERRKMSTATLLLSSAAIGAFTALAAADPPLGLYELADINTAGEPSGIVIDGDDFNDMIGEDVAGEGDFNGDGVTDLLISGLRARPKYLPGTTTTPGVDDYGAGRVYILYGQSSPSSSISLDETGSNDILNSVIFGTQPQFDGDGGWFGGALAGDTVSFLGDINNDGYDDIGIGETSYWDPVVINPTSPCVNSSVEDWEVPWNVADDLCPEDPIGRGYVLYGSANAPFPNLGPPFAEGILNDVDSTDPKIQDVSFLAINPDKLGKEFRQAGDINDDGYDDFLFTVPSYDLAGGNTSEGCAVLIYGRNGNLLYNEVEIPTDIGNGTGGTTRGAVFKGNEQFAYVAYVGLAGDVNGDGIDDFLIGESDADANGGASGRVYLIYGQKTKSTVLEGSYDLDNVTGMGGDDSIEGAVFEGQQIFGHAGYSVMAAGDVDKDGYSDFLIGEPGANTTAELDHASNVDTPGAVYLVYGAADVSGVPAISGEYWLDHDPDEGAGERGVFESGDTSAGPRWALFQGRSDNDFTGYRVYCAGDFNNDTYPDFMISAPGVSSSTGGAYGPDHRLPTGGDHVGHHAGAVYLVYGHDGNGSCDTLEGVFELGDLHTLGSLTAPLYGAMFKGEYGHAQWNVNGVLTSKGAGEWTGKGIAAGGDFNDDGYDDIVIGAPGWDRDVHPSGSSWKLDAGRVYVIYGVDEDLPSCTP